MTADDELAELLRAERAMQPPPLATERGWSRLAADLAANVPPIPIGAGALGPSLWLVPTWVLAGLVLGLAGAGVVSPLLTPSAVAVNAPSAPRRVASALPSVNALPESPPPELATASVTPVSNRRAEPALAPAAAASASSASATFDAEMKLIARSKAQLDARQFALARAALDEHAAQFPFGVFATERDALRALVSCTQGPKNVALAERFAVQHPGSPLAERVEHACGTSRAPIVSESAATADFSKLPNGGAPAGEPMAEPSTGVER